MAEVPTFKNRENPCIKTIDGGEIWYSRSMAVCVMFIAGVEDYRILVCKRGPSVDNANKWCMPCGYLDWDEDLTDAARRELFEETGVVGERDIFRLAHISSNPDKHRQNITAHFIYWWSNDEMPTLAEPDGKEVLEYAWVTLKNVDQFEWAFNHGEYITRIFNNKRHVDVNGISVTID